MTVPDEFEAGIGNGLDGYYEVQLEGSRLFYTQQAAQQGELLGLTSMKRRHRFLRAIEQ